jgi:hypothetical protein
MFGRSLPVVSLIATVVVAPPVARAQLLCRSTGMEITAASNCHEAHSPGGHLLRTEGCCDHRVQAPLPLASPGSGPMAPVGRVVEVQLRWFEAFQPSGTVVDEALPLLRPPLSETGILLI